MSATTDVSILRQSNKLKFALLIIITLIAIFFRFHQLKTLPPGDGFDPAYYGLDALRILDGEFPIYFATNFGREVIFSYLVALVYLFTGPGTFGIHVASALVAVLTIPAVFLVADEFFKREQSGILTQFGGVLAALLTAISFWHLMWSRYSVRAILIPLFVSLLCFFLLRALRTQQKRYFALTGIVMGLSFYTYQLAQLFPILVAIGIAFDLIARRAFNKTAVKQIAIIYGVAFLLALPLLTYAVQNPDVFNQRVSAVYVLEDATEKSDQIDILRTNILNVIKMYTIEGDSDPLINIPKRPSLNPLLSIAFILGILFSAYRWRRPNYLFLLSWLLLMSAPAFLADSAAMSKRALGALPAVMILISFALLHPFDYLGQQKQAGLIHKKRQLLPYGFLFIFILLMSAFTTYNDLFQKWGKDPALYTHYNVGVAEIGQYIASIPEDETIYLSPTWIDHATLKLHSNNRENIHAYNGRHCFVYPQRTQQETHYIVVPSDESTSLPLLTEYFPNGQVVDEGYLGNGNLYYTAYQIPAGTPAQFEPTQKAYSNWADEVAVLGYDVSNDTFHPGDTITINIYFKPLKDMALNYTSYIHLLGPADPETGNTLWAQVDREPCFQSYPTSWWHDNEIIRDTFTMTISPDAPAGEHQIAMGFYHWPEMQQMILVESENDTNQQESIAKTIKIIPK